MLAEETFFIYFSSFTNYSVNGLSTKATASKKIEIEYDILTVDTTDD